MRYLEKLKTILICTFVCSLTICLRPAEAQTTSTDLEKRVRNLEAKLGLLDRQEQTRENREIAPSAEESELAKIRLQLQLPAPLGTNDYGFAPGMSRIYSARTPIAVGGFADINFISGSSADSGARSTTVARFNPYFAWRFSEGLVFNSGLTFVNGGSGTPDGGARVEFAYLDLLTGVDSGLRIGHVIIPFGLTAFRFEPNLYPFVNRPRPERTIIPSTWHENGLLGFGKIGGVLLQGGIVGSGDASLYQTDTWIAAGRQSGGNAKMSDPAGVVRAEILTETARTGLSVYAGNSSQGNGALQNALVLLAEIHGELSLGRLQLKALYTEGSLGDTDRIQTLTTRAIGSRARGGWASASFDLLAQVAPLAQSLTRTLPGSIIDERMRPGRRSLPVFVGYEFDDVMAQPTSGQAPTSDKATMRSTIGVNYLPHPQVALKGDFVYESVGNGSNARIFELGVAAVF